ncbi:hypothetical protein [Helicobacter suis]|uniref:hypothetical protein n=1 Tax=Helicobacter suis TaxID=104628 RepID=UPI0013D065C3|nr:hypothetical protein [Helicobacter suis]
MAVSMVGNVTYVNQNTPYGSIINQNALPKLSEINHQEFLERLQVVQATRALEENRSVHEDKEESNQYYSQDQNQSSDSKSDTNTQDKAHSYHGHYYSDDALKRAVENTEELEQLVDSHVLDVTI